MKHVYQAKADEADTGGTDAVEEEVVEEKVEEKHEPDPVEAKALKMGWTPKDQFRGDPEKWRDAKEFVERGENMLPIMRKTAERQERQIAELQQTVRDLAEFSTKVEQKSYKRALDELKAQQIAAVAAGDAAGFVKVDKAIEELRDEAAKKPNIKFKDPGEDPEYKEWEAANRWAVTDPKAKAYAESYAEYMRNTGSELVGTEFLDEVKKAVKKEFPEKFSNPRRNEPGAVESSNPPAKKGGKTFADLPADAKAACERMARNGFDGKPKEMAEFKANFVKNFEWE